MGFFNKVFGSNEDDQGSALSRMPWEGRASIFAFVRAHVLKDMPGLAEDGYTLPDEEQTTKGSKIRWAAGAMDGVGTHHMAGGKSDETVKRTVDLIRTYWVQPTAANKAVLYEHLITMRVVSIIDPVIEAIVDQKDIVHARLYELARSFVLESADREPVKLGIAILGLFKQASDQELFQIIGRHDEFTLFSVVAISNFPGSSDEGIWNLARNVTGWGRIHAVERLSQTTNPAIKDWILREGFRNSVMYEYLAATCARTGGLLAAINNDRIDRELLTAAGEIIEALIAEGPTEGIDGYEDARPVIESYLAHVGSMAETLEDFLHVNAIHGFLNQEGPRWANRYQAGWSAEDRDSLRSLCRSILSGPQWVQRVGADLRSSDEAKFSRAAEVAKSLGIYIWDIHWKRLQEKPTNPGRWFYVVSMCDEHQIERAIEFAQSHLDLEAIATGAADEIGLGPGYEQHSCLGYVLQELRRFPGKGLKLMRAALKSPVVSNRNMAVAALAAWPRQQWPDVVEQLVTEAAEIEPQKTVRERMKKMLNGEPFTS